MRHAPVICGRNLALVRSESLQRYSPCPMNRNTALAARADAERPGAWCAEFLRVRGACIRRGIGAKKD
jgi:hypothetical protein